MRKPFFFFSSLAARVYSYSIGTIYQPAIKEINSILILNLQLTVYVNVILFTFAAFLFGFKTKYKIKIDLQIEVIGNEIKNKAEDCFIKLFQNDNFFIFIKCRPTLIDC